MKKIIRTGQSVVVMLDDGTILQNDGCDDALYKQLIECENDSDRAVLLLPNLQKTITDRKDTEEFLNKVRASQYLSLEGSSIYWRIVSELSIPRNFAEKILAAEDNEDMDAIESYRNFWTLLSLNPDERVRQNLFWFLDNWGMRISKTGLFVGYRNVDIKEYGTESIYSQELCDFVVHSYEEVRKARKALADYWIIQENSTYILINSTQLLFKELEEGECEKYNLREVYNELKAVNFKVRNAGDNTVYTDHHSHSMEIRIGEMVTLDRKECDCDSGVECSRGLHLGGTTWLEQNYYGSVGLACLCNPRDVVAIPHDSCYGKLRTCAYLPVAKVEYGENRHVIPLNVDDGFESAWVKTILYDGLMCTETSPTYKIEVPDIPELNKPFITESILQIARKYMK